eukprot:3019362-Alexandrium_andersonii.AAC.1
MDNYADTRALAGWQQHPRPRHAYTEAGDFKDHVRSTSARSMHRSLNSFTRRPDRSHAHRL